MLYFSISSYVSPAPPTALAFYPLALLISTSAVSSRIRLPWNMLPILPKLGAPPLDSRVFANLSHANSICSWALLCLARDANICRIILKRSTTRILRGSILPDSSRAYYYSNDISIELNSVSVSISVGDISDLFALLR